MSDFKQIIKHSGNYLIANLATRALAFISIPVYTRLLSTEEYGVINIFLGVAGVLGSVMSLSMDRSVSRYFFDQKNPEDFRKFNGTSSILASIAFIINALILVYFADGFGKLVGLDNKIIYLLIPYTFINIIGLTFEQIYGPLKKSKEIAISSLARVYIGFALSIFLILLFKEDKSFGQILGQILAGVAIIFYWIKKIRPFVKFSFNIAYIKYIFTYSVPLIPYALSGVIIEQFGKIAIGSSQSLSQAGYYSLALAISSIVSIAIAVTHQAWNPYYFEYMNSKNYPQLDKDFIRIFKITVLVAFGIAAFGEEIGFFLAKKEFLSSMHLIPIFTIGYIFYQLSYAYLRNFGYSRSTQYMTITVFASGISNVLLNFILIPTLGELGAAVSFALSYIVMAFLAWIINKFLVKLHATPLKLMLIPMIIAVPFYLLLYFTPFIEFLILSIIIKFLLCCLLIVIIFWSERIEIIHFSKALLPHHK